MSFCYSTVIRLSYSIIVTSYRTLCDTGERLLASLGLSFWFWCVRFVCFCGAERSDSYRGVLDVVCFCRAERCDSYRGVLDVVGFCSAEQSVVTGIKGYLMLCV